jgi:hypothetical protein
MDTDFHFCFTEFKEAWLSDGFIQLLCFLVFLAAIGDVALYNNLFLLEMDPGICSINGIY